MKKVLHNKNGWCFFTCFILFMTVSIVKAQLFQQQFTNDFTTMTTGSSTSDVNYLNASPSNAQMTFWGVSAGGSIGVSGAQLNLGRTGGAAGLTRITSFSGSPTSLMIRFDFNVTSCSSASTTGLVFSVGQNFTNTSSAQTTVNTHSSLNLTAATTPSWKVNNVGTANTSLQTVLWVINNSGSTMTYKAPDGTFESVVNDAYDAWVGSTKVVDENMSATAPGVITPANSLNNFALRLGNSTSTSVIDNVLIDPIPAVPTSNAASNILSTSFTANWTAIAGATGYKIDVATDAAFTSIVQSDIAAAGQATNSQAISGLTAGTTYYYRVRAENTYTVGTFTGGNSATQTTATVLPIELAAFNAKANGNTNLLTWSTATEKNNQQFNIERSADGSKFTNIGTVKGSGTTTTANNYTFTDETPLSINYYRLQSVDFDGKTQASNIVSVFRSTSGKMKVYPTVASDKLNIVLDNNDTQIFSIVDLMGKTILTGQLTGQKELSISTLATGTYILKVGGEVVKFVKN